MPLVVGILLLGSEPEIHSTYFMLIVIASAFRILVTFVIVLEVRGIFFFQIPWTTYGRSSSLNWNITTGLFLRSSPFINRDSASSTFLHGLSGRNMLNLVRHTNLCIHNSENYMFLWVVLFSCILTLVYQLIVKSMRAFVYRCLLLLWSVKPFCPEWLGETNSSTSSISRIGSKKLCSADQIANPAFVLLYLGVLPSFISGLL